MRSTERMLKLTFLLRDDVVHTIPLNSAANIMCPTFYMGVKYQNPIKTV